MFFSVITKNLNWDVLSKNLVTFGVGLRVKNFNITRFHWKIRFLVWLGCGVPKNQYIGGISWKEGLEQFTDLKWGLTRKMYTMVNPFHTIGLFLYPLKISENLSFSNVFRGGGV